LRKLIIVLLSLTLIAIPSFQAMLVLAAEPSTISRDELLGSWKGTVKITKNYSPSDDTEWIADAEAKEYIAAFYEPSTTEVEKDSLYFIPPSDVFGIHGIDVIVDAQGVFDGYSTLAVEYTDRLIEWEHFYTGKIIRKGTGLLMILEIRIDTVTTKFRNSEIINTSHTYTYTMFPVNASSDESLEFGTGIEKGRISFVEGRAHIQRGNRIIPAVVGEGLLAGDTVVSESGMVTIEGEASGSLKIPAGIRLEIPEEKAVKKTSSSSLSVMIGNIWGKTKELLGGESFEVKTPTGTCGVRG